MHQSEPLAKRVVAAFGGLSKTAKALGHAHVTTVDYWFQTGRIPPWRLAEIRAAAERERVELPHDFPASAA